MSRKNLDLKVKNALNMPSIPEAKLGQQMSTNNFHSRHNSIKSGMHTIEGLQSNQSVDPKQLKSSPYLTIASRQQLASATEGGIVHSNSNLATLPLTHDKALQ